MKDEFKVDFFIVGAPKCGTTSLYYYLSQHPDVFMPEIKEPHYFATDFDKYRYINNIKDYNKLFKDRKDNQICGEASVWYLYSEEAIKNIHEYNPNAKIIIMLRDPVEMVHSLHSELLLSPRENVKNFEDAWDLSFSREKGEKIPFTCIEPKHILYHKVADYYNQLNRVYNYFDSNQVKIILFNDFKEQTEKTFKDILVFLNLPEISIDYIVHNKSKIVKFKFIIILYSLLPNFLKEIHNKLKFISVYKKIVNFIHIINHKEKKRSNISDSIKNKLLKEYSETIDLLHKKYKIKL